MLLGHSDGYTADIGHLRVTYHHNFFNGTNQRHPRVRFGEPVHVYNNYYLQQRALRRRVDRERRRPGRGQLLRERRVPGYSINGYADSGRAGWSQRNNIFVNSGVARPTAPSADPRTFYSYTAERPGQRPALVRPARRGSRGSYEDSASSPAAAAVLA